MTEKKVIETPYGWYQKNDDKVNVDEIIGIVKTDGQTNSVQLKKEAQLSICEKRLIELEKENEQLKARLYAEKTNTAEVINDYAKQFKRHSTQFSFMIDLAEDLGINISKLGALDD